MTAEREAQDVEYAAAVRADNERGEEELTGGVDPANFQEER